MSPPLLTRERAVSGRGAIDGLPAGIIEFLARHGATTEIGPAQENIGGGAVQEDCSFDSFEACRRLVIQGNRGFCGQNPAFRGDRQPPPRKKKRSVR